MNSIEVTGCEDCILAEYTESGSSVCIHPKKRKIYLYEDDKTGKLITPSDCPLLAEPLIISLKTE